jgi:hypothetical protein
MLEMITVHFMPSTPATEERATPRAGRLAREAMTLAMGCVAAVGITLGLYLVAPAELRDGIVTAFLGFDQPIKQPFGTPHAHPPLP